ncbi:myo-inositol 2-dehydrogenase-like isoform X2 [Grus americana]|uniref:myo-inositol 2-dehydrogenase-like isoform X2 n=1 Tax=Grus americana TaxID=9117 RepID=UPI002407C17D|nr:myo-inositol 2-dehydrogenase-like isoform X2 [Grus americana]
MGRKKKTLHDYAAEFSELAVKRHLLERGAAGEAAVVETLYCTSCQLPMRVRRDRILEHLSSGRHYRNRRLLRQHGLRAPLLLSAGPDVGTGLPLQLDAPSLLSQPSFILAAGTGTGYGMVPSPPSCHKPLVPLHPASAAAPREDPTPSTSASRPSALAAFHVRIAPAPSKQAGQREPVPEAHDSPVPTTRHSSGIGLALFGVGLLNKALFQSLLEETGCCLLYVVEDQLEEVERAFNAEFLAGTRVLRQQDADIALNDQRVSGAIICSPPEEASEIVIDALRAGKGVFCERLPSFDRQTAEACFDEADRCGRPLVCGFYKRFDPALQFLYKKVRDSQALGRIHRISTISSIYPAASLSFLKTSDMACLKDADTVAVSMKFPSGAIVTLDVSQHCTKSCDQRLEVHGSQGTLRVDNQNPLGITEHGTSVSIYSQTQADRYRDAHRELFRHFLRTLKGKEPPAITKEQFLWTIQVAAAAEQSWRNGSAVDLRSAAIDSSVIKTEIM